MSETTFFDCPHCQAELKLNPGVASPGDTIGCPSCEKDLQVPQLQRSGSSSSGQQLQEKKTAKTNAKKMVLIGVVLCLFIGVGVGVAITVLAVRKTNNKGTHAKSTKTAVKADAREDLAHRSIDPDLNTPVRLQAEQPGRTKPKRHAEARVKARTVNVQPSASHVTSLRVCFPRTSWLSEEVVAHSVVSAYAKMGIKPISVRSNTVGTIEEDAALILTTREEGMQYMTTYRVGALWMDKKNNHLFPVFEVSSMSSPTAEGLNRTILAPLFEGDVSKLITRRHAKLEEMDLSLWSGVMTPDSRWIFSCDTEGHLIVRDAEDNCKKVLEVDCPGGDLAVSNDRAFVYGKDGLRTYGLSILPKLSDVDEVIKGKLVEDLHVTDNGVVALVESNMTAFVASGRQPLKQVGALAGPFQRLCANDRGIVWLFSPPVKDKDAKGVNVTVCRIGKDGKISKLGKVSLPSPSDGWTYVLGSDLAVAFRSLKSIEFEKGAKQRLSVFTLAEAGIPRRAATIEGTPVDQVLLADDLLVVQYQFMVRVFSLESPSDPKHLADVPLAADVMTASVQKGEFNYPNLLLQLAVVSGFGNYRMAVRDATLQVFTSGLTPKDLNSLVDIIHIDLSKIRGTGLAR